MAPINLTEEDKKIIGALQGDLPIIKHPFLKIARNLSMNEQDLIKHIKRFIKRGIIRRFGAIIYHDRSGFEANVMVAWKAEEDKLSHIGKIMASLPEITHCYARVSCPEWPYNLYTMVHGKNEKECHNTIKHIVEKTGLSVYRLLFTKKTFKRTSMEYF